MTVSNAKNMFKCNGDMKITVEIKIYASLDRSDYNCESELTQKSVIVSNCVFKAWD